MSHDEKKDKAILRLLEQYGRRTPNVLRSAKNAELREYLISLFPVLQNCKYTDGMRLYWLANGIDDFPTCRNAMHGEHKNMTSRCRITGYETPYCCSKCAHEAGYENGRKTRLDLYGSETWNNPAKRAATNIEKYGCENAACNEDVIDRIQSKRRARLDLIMEKAWATRRSNTGEKFGMFPYWDKIFLQFLDESGVVGFEHRHYSKKEKIKLRFKIKAYNKMKSSCLFTPCFTINEWLAIDDPFKNKLKWKCQHDHEFISEMKSHYKEYLRCPICDPYLDVGTSKVEKSMQEFLNSIWPHPETDRNRRDIIKPLELDDFISDKRIAFELDGLYTHCDLNKKNGYHQMKTKMCRSADIRLIHIFEDEWNDKRAICESYIKTALGLNEKVNASRLGIRKLMVADFERFASENCIDLLRGKRPEVCYGLYDVDDLVYAAGFNHTWANKYEIERPCCLLNFDIEGGLDMVLNAFVSEFSPSYVSLNADRRWFDETSIHTKMMRLSSRLKSGFYYVNYGYDRRYRPETVTSELLSGLKRYDENATLEENIKLCKFAKIYDCGQLVYTWKRKDQS